MPATHPAVPRPSFHFTPRRHWMNDPNGLVHDRGLWHLYFQYNPEGPDWGNMSWGHATSADLRHWTEHPVALSYRDGEQIFSGSVVATRDGDGPLLTAYYTSAFDDGRQAQSRATSRDGGWTWQPDAGNPVLDRGSAGFRDPKIIRFADEWIMLAVEADDRQLLVYSSADLRSWTLRSTFGPLGDEDVAWECPDLVRLALDDNPDDPRWVLLLSTNTVGDEPRADGSSMHYLVGGFDGAVFTPETPELLRFDHGRDFYAGVTFDSAPGGAAIALGWMSNWRYAAAFPSAPWRGAMSLPRRLALRTIGGVPHLVQQPPPFVHQLLTGATPATAFGTARPAEHALSGHSIVDLRWDPAATGALRLTLHGDADAVAELHHDPAEGRLHISRSGPAAEAVHPDFPGTSQVPLSGTSLARLLISLDGPLLEVFAGDGETTASHLVVLGPGPVTATLHTALGGPVTISAVDVPALVPA